MSSYLCTLPFVSVNSDDVENRVPLAVYIGSVDSCELKESGDCIDNGLLFGDEDPNSAVFCARHFHRLHIVGDGQYRIEPMSKDEVDSMVR